MVRRVAMALVVVVAGACASRRAADAPSPVAAAPAAPTGTPMSEPEEYRDRPISIAAGRDYFARFGVGDPYATGIAYPIFLALMRAYPNELGRDWSDFAKKFGFVFDGDQPKVPAGFHLTTDPYTNVEFVVMSCHLCHSATIKLPSGDLFVSGIGSTRVRVHAYDAAMTRIGLDVTAEKIAPLAERAAIDAGAKWPEAWRKPIVDATLREWKRRAEIRSGGTKKLERAMPGRVATIESFMMALDTHAGTHLAFPERTGWAKVPDVRGFRYRETLSWDGSATGAPSVLVAEADFAFGARPAWYDAHRHIGTSMFLFLRAFERKLPFPGAIDRDLAARGRGVFDAKCATCHGTYSGEAGRQRAVYEERVVPIATIGTDDARLRALTPEIVAAANAIPITRGLTHVAPTNGYVPPVLIDVWARGLYGHAGQWPSLDVLAMRPEDRPRTFVVASDAPYDLERVGSRWRSASPMDDATLAPGEYVYDASSPGCGVGGHPFLSDLPAADRRAVLEYAKTL